MERGDSNAIFETVVNGGMLPNCCNIRLAQEKPLVVLPYTGYIGMCFPKEYGFSAILAMRL